MEVKDIFGQVKSDITDFTQENNNGLIIIRGATATGKSGLAILAADFLPIEIISSDSRQIFKYMDIGTDKVSKEIRDTIPHHQIDIVEPDENYTAGEWKFDTDKIITSIIKKEKIPIITGGTGLYIDTIYKNIDLTDAQPDMELRDRLYKKEEANPGYLHKHLTKIDPNEALKIHPNSLRYLVRAIEIYEQTGKPKSEIAIEHPLTRPTLMIGLWREKEDSNTRIDKRIKQMFNEGLVDEVRGLLDKGYTANLQSMNGIGYKEIIGYLQGDCDIEQAEEFLKINTHRYAKRQRTWFRKYINDSKHKPKDKAIYKLYNLSK